MSSTSNYLNLTIDETILKDYTSASSREWLVTNGLGGYASSSLSGANTRRYHGLLVSTLNPPSDRRVLLSKVEDSVSIGESTVELSANQYPGAIPPHGFRFLERF